MDNEQIVTEAKKKLQRRRWGGLGLLTAGLLLTAWFLYAQGRSRLVEPLSDGLWRLYDLLQSISQEQLWGILLILILADMAALLWGVSHIQTTERVERPLGGRVNAWREMLQAAGLRGFLGQRLIGAARMLLINDLVERDNRPFETAHQQAFKGSLPLSAEAQQTLGYRPSPQDEPEMSRDQRRRLILNVMDEIAGYLEAEEERKRNA